MKLVAIFRIISNETTHLLMIINGYSGKTGLQKAIDHAIDLLDKYAELKEYSVSWLD